MSAGGNTSKDEIARLDRDVINKKPAWVTISCGVDDVWHGRTGVTLDMRAELKKRQGEPHPHGNLLTVDCVHMNPFGNEVMAAAVLHAFGLDDAQINTAHAAWDELPAACEVQVKTMFSMKYYQKLSEIAAQQNKSVPDMANEAMEKGMDQLLKTDSK